MTNLLYDIANEYVHFELQGKIIKIPYCIVKFEDDDTRTPMARTSKDRNYAGKGTVDQIRSALVNTAFKEKFNLEKSSPEKITQFMITQGIGIDCSGFVYNVLDAYLKKEKNISLANILLRYPGILGKVERFFFKNNRVRRISAATLTSDLNTKLIKSVTDIRPGDLMRLTPPGYLRGKHIAIIIDVNEEYIIYAHSSEATSTKGPHFCRINIIDAKKGLEYQQWLEVTQEGRNYQHYAFNPKIGDSVRRLRWFI